MLAALFVAGFAPRKLSAAPDCSATACPSKCSCSEQKCASELSACLADAACVKGQACASACPCGSNTCLAKCGILHPSLKAASLLACTEKSCSSLEGAAAAEETAVVAVEAAGACTDAADLAAWESTDKAHLVSGMTDCIIPCVNVSSFDSECYSKCIATKVGFTAGCADCFGAWEAEVYAKCAAPCEANPKSRECSACETEALADLKTCTGFTDIPRPPTAAAAEATAVVATAAPDCSATACPSKCSCSEQKCASELSACLADAACVKGQACASACPCGSNTCLAKCGILHPSLKAASLLACTERSCSSLDTASVEDSAEPENTPYPRIYSYTGR